MYYNVSDFYYFTRGRCQHLKYWYRFFRQYGTAPTLTNTESVGWEMPRDIDASESVKHLYFKNNFGFLVETLLVIWEFFLLFEEQKLAKLREEDAGEGGGGKVISP